VTSASLKNYRSLSISNFSFSEIDFKLDGSMGMNYDSKKTEQTNQKT
jgi:hypothetical protein